MHKPAPAWPNPISITCAAPASDLLLHQAAITAASGASPLRGEIPLPALPQQGLEGSWGGSEDLCTPRGSLWCSLLPSLSAGLRVLCLSDGKGDMGLAQNHRKKPRFLQYLWQTRLWGFPAPQPLAGGNGVGTACKPCSHVGNNPAAFGGQNSGPGGSPAPTTSYTGAAPKSISPLPQAHRGRTAPIPSHTSILQQQGHQPLRNSQPLSGGKSSTPKTPNSSGTPSPHHHHPAAPNPVPSVSPRWMLQ